MRVSVARGVARCWCDCGGKKGAGASGGRRACLRGCRGLPLPIACVDAVPYPYLALSHSGRGGPGRQCCHEAAAEGDITQPLAEEGGEDEGGARDQDGAWVQGGGGGSI